jgi:hypothetical protein
VKFAHPLAAVWAGLHNQTATPGAMFAIMVDRLNPFSSKSSGCINTPSVVPDFERFPKME